MDSPYDQDQILHDLHHPRSRASSRLSVNTNRLEDLNLNESYLDHSTQPVAPSSDHPPQVTANPSTSTESRRSPAFLARPNPASYAQFPISSHPDALAQDWSYIHTSSDPSHAPPRLELQEPQDQTALNNIQNHQTLSPQSYNQSEMSTLGIQFDSRFDAGGRSSYSWPVFDMPQNTSPYGNHNMAPSLDPFSEVGNEAIYARSLSSSPPQGIFSAEQRELKRQRDLARRSSKSRVRRERSSSNSYGTSQATTPDMIPRSSLNYSQSSITPMSLSSEAMMPMAGNPYLPSSSAATSSSESPEMYSAQFPLVSNDFGNSQFLMPFTTGVADASIPSFPTRPSSISSLSDSSYLFRNPPLMTQDSPDTVRVVHSRPKPQCWDHGCNGRQFSTFSNLLRHQREKSGVASKPTCPKCGAEFTRTTARNGHMAHEKCKQRRNS